MSNYPLKSVRLVSLLIALTLDGFALLAQPVLLRTTTPPAPGSVTIRTPHGGQAVGSPSIEPSANLVVVIAAATLSAEDADSVKKALPVLFKAMGDPSSLRLAILSANDAHIAGPFRTLREFQVAVKEIQAEAAVDAPPSPTIYYSALPDTLRQFGSDWTSLLLIGRLPTVDPALHNFASTFLCTKFLAQRTRFSYWNLAAEPLPFLDATVHFTSGAVVTSDIASFADFLKSDARSYVELLWEEKVPVKGFDLHKDELMLPDGPLAFPHIALAANVAMPDLGRYALYREQLQIAAALQQEKGKEDHFRAALDLVLSINAGDRQALRMGADFYSRQNDRRHTVTLLSSLAEIEVDNGGLFAEIGHHLFEIADLAAAEKALLRARELTFTNALVSEELARIHLQREDFAGVIPLLDETLKTSPARQDLWFLRADCAARANNWTVEADSLEHGLKLGGANVDRRTVLVRLYLAHGDAAHASAQVDTMVAQMPADAAVHATYATFLEQLSRPEDALKLWKKTIDVDTSYEPAHFAVTRLLRAKNDLRGALGAADSGIAAAPKSARLRLLKAQLFEQQHEIYDARRTLSAAASLNDVSLLEYAAQFEETFGTGAPKIYQHLAETYGNTGSTEVSRVLERGLQVSLRDADDEHARWFAEKLETAHLAKSPSHPVSPGIWIPGGFAALAFMAHGKESSSADDFLTDYARSILRNVGPGNPDPYRESLREYFERINTLIQLGRRDKDRVIVSVSLSDKPSQQKTDKVLGILGWKLVRSKNQLTIESGVKAKQARRQDLASALAIDQVGMAKAFAEGKPYDFEILFERAAIALDETTWQPQYSGEKLSGGLVEALPRNLHLARVYLGLSSVDRATAEAIVSSVGLKLLVEKHSALLATYSSALVVADGRVQTPGGIRAADFWKALVGVSPSDPNHFLRTLFEKDEGRVLAFFFTLSHLDSAHQRFFTLNASRISRFYDLFRESPEVKLGVARPQSHDSFASFLRGVPLDSDGAVDFPGSPEVWMVVKQSNSVERNTRLLTKAHQKAAPDVEDEILIRLARTQYKNAQEKRSELENFLAVVRIDEHRSDPLDEASAISLAQNFPRYSTLYPYLSVFTGLSEREFNQLFRFGDKLKTASQLDLNLTLGQFHSLWELLRITLAQGGITEKQSTELFFQLCDSFARAGSPADYTLASLNLIRSLLIVNGSAAPLDADAALRNLMMAQHAPVVFELSGLREIDSTKLRRADFDRVLALQNIPRLQPLLDISVAVHAIAEANGSPAAQLKTLEAAVALLPSVEVPKELKQGKIGKALNAAEQDKLPALIARLRQKTTAKKVNPKDLEKLEQELLAELEPSVRLALSGPVYAFYFRSDDLLVAEDSLLVRKHRFVNITDGSRPPDFPATELKLGEDPKRGSFFVGGFSEFAIEAARASLAGSKYDGQNAMEVAAVQVAAIRSAPLSDWLDSDQRLLGLKLRVAREWCIRAAYDAHVLQDLSEETLGLLSSARRRDLLTGLATRDWVSVRQSLTLSDLYFIGDHFSSRYKDSPSPSLASIALDRALSTDDGHRLQMLGSLLPNVSGCSHPHLLRLPPFEDFEHRLPDAMAQRANEFKLYLADFMDRRGLPAQAITVFAEPVLRRLLAGLTMSDAHDWRSVLAVYGKIDDDLLEEALKKP